MELILLRHGATEGNLLRQYIGITDLPLAPQGVAQAAGMRDTLPCPNLICSSPLSRCTQTAQLIWPGQPIHQVPELRETDFGAFEGKTWQELKDNAAYRAWIDGTGECPSGESRQAAALRVQSAWAHYYALAQSKQAETLAVVTHGGVIMELLAAHCGGQRYDWQPALCTGWRVVIDHQGRWQSPKNIP